MQQDGRIHNYNQNLHLISQNVEANTRAVRDTQDMIKIVQKQISEKLRQKLKIENEIQEFETQFQITEKEHTVVANLLKEKRKEMDGLGGHKVALEEEQKIFLG